MGLLDMCSVDSTDCIEADEGNHVGCCCGYNPITSLGMRMDTTGVSIEGIKHARFGGTARVTRRLALIIGTNICGEAGILSRAKIAEYHKSVDPTELYKSKAALKNLFPAFYNQCSTAPSPPNSSPRRRFSRRRRATSTTTTTTFWPFWTSPPRRRRGIPTPAGRGRRETTTSFQTSAAVCSQATLPAVALLLACI